MWASPFQRYLMNLRQQLHERSVYYMTKLEAYEELKRLSGQDFAYDDQLWERWGRENGQFFPGT